MIDPIDDLFGAPPLIRGEDLARYERLLAAIEHEIKPKTIFDKIRVRELTLKYWELQRCQQNVVALVEGSRIEALANLLRAFIEPAFMSFGDEDAACKMARDHYSGCTEPDELNKVHGLRDLHAISDEQIRAEAMRLCGPGVLMFIRMETSCETSLRQFQKEHDRRLAAENSKKPDSEESEAA
jgi:hypothetical protein